VNQILLFDNVSRHFRSASQVVTAVDRVSLTLGRGEVVALVGPSGSGKTTTMHLAIGWERPDSGQITLDVAARGWAGVAVIPQELGLLPELSARENVELVSRLIGRTPPDFDEMFDHLGLGALGERYPDELSMGEQQRVAVARAASAQPDLLIADEPTAHQDELRADLVMEQLGAVAERGGAVLVATHDIRLLDRVDRVVEMLDGRVVEHGQPVAEFRSHMP
jgi:putative ABC transport system ATP-binding protein